MKKVLLILIFLIAVFIQLIFLSLLSMPDQRNQSSDYITFHEPVAQNILNGKGIVDTEGKLGIRYPPGYPVILSVIFDLADLTGFTRLNFISGFNILITAFSCVLVFLIGELIFNTKIGLISSLIWITYPFNLWLIKQPNTEIPFIFFLYSAILVFILSVSDKQAPLISLLKIPPVRGDYLHFTFFTGILLGLAALIRPAGILLIAVFTFFFLFYKNLTAVNKIIYTMILLTGFIIAVLPWEVYIFASTGRIIPLASCGPIGIKDGLTFAVKSGQRGHRANVPEDVMNLMQRIANNPDLNTTSSIVSYMVDELKNRPVTVIELFVIKVVRSWYGTDEMWYENYTLLIQMFYLIMGIIGFIVGIRTYKDSIFYMIFLAGIVVYFWLMAVAVLSILRYMIPSMIAVIIFGAILIDSVISIRKPDNSKVAI